MKKKRNIFFIVLLLLCGVMVGTYAYYSISMSFDNNFSISNFNVVIEENYDVNSSFGGVDNISNVSKEVFVVNKEDVPAIVRISYNEQIDNADLPEAVYKNVQNNLSSNSDIVVKNWTETFVNDWVLVSGWYYYTKILPAGESIQILESISYDGNVFDYGTYNLDFNIEAVQATEDAVEELWDRQIIVNDDGSLTLEFLTK